MSTKRIDTEVIQQAAADISSINNQLTDILTRSKQTVNSLQGVWTGAAADETISAYNAFDTKYTQEYKQMLENYAIFLNQVAAQGYSETEAAVTRAADQI